MASHGRTQAEGHPMTAHGFTTHQPGLPEPRWPLTWLFPIAVYPVLIASIFVSYDFWYFMKHKEGGIERLAVVCLLVGVGYGVRMLLAHRRALPRAWLVWWFAIATAGMVFVAGEEVSWGQHLGLWGAEDVPEPIREINDQGETNIHNIVGIGNAIDRGSTNLVIVGTFVAFFILPIVQRVKGTAMPCDDPGYLFWPTRAGFWAGVGVSIIPLPLQIYEWTTGREGSFDWRHSEIHEFYIALLMMTYMVSVHHRLRAYAAVQRGDLAAADLGGGDGHEHVQGQG
jgi:hypothetical protein